MPVKFNAHLTAAGSEAEARARIEAIGADEDGVVAMTPKMRHYNVKLEDVPVAGADIIKRSMLALGAEAAESAGAYAGEGERTDVILMGTVHQLEALAKKISGQPFELDALAKDLPGLIRDVERVSFELKAAGKKISLGQRPLIMGILNCTPDSFYDGGRFADPRAAIARGKELLAGGADILDVGGESTRPGSAGVDPDEELKRVLPVIEALSKEGALVSVDTRKAKVADKAVAAGACIINDVSALADPDMAKVAADTGAALVLMHMLGEPGTMQNDPSYKDLFGEIIAYLRARMDRAEAAGVDREAMMIDPGIGFGKTVAHNLELVRDLWRLRSLGRPILLGPSNKSFIGKVLDAGPDERSQGTAASLVAGVLAGAHVLRVHDAAGMKPFVDMAFALSRGEKWES